MKDKLLIIGASGHGKVVADIALKMNRWKSISFLDDNENIQTSLGLKIIGNSNDISKHIDECDIFVGIGNNAIRGEIQKKLESMNASIPILIHPTAVIGEQVSIGVGTVIMPGTIINSCSKVGKGCIINTSATIDHDSLLEDYVHISPGVHLAGTVRVGKQTWLGIGSIVSNNIHITKECKFGAGAVVVENVIEKGTYVGVPARRI